MAKNPKQYGLEDVAMERPADYDTVTIDYPVDLRLVAECIGSTPSELQDLNPSLLRMTTPRAGKFELHLPAGTREDYETAIASIPPDMRLWWRYHVVKPGDTLASLAHTYRTTIKQISEVNHLEDRQLDPQAKLVIPVTPGKHPASDTATYARRITRYKVRKGDTVQSVADNFGVSAQQLRRWNGIRSSTNSLAGRRVLALHLPISPSAHDAELATSRSKSKRPKTETASTKPPTTKSSEIERLKPEKELAVVHHRVRSGETLYSIANAYRTTVGALKRDNRNVRVIRPGMILNIQIVR
jgi:membrane-bound lytic murein transglycosylase D